VIKVYSDLSEVEILITKFQNKTLTLADWTHNAHLTVGLYFVAKYGRAKAMDMLRDCIFTYNASVGTINSDTGGYHETITQFWVWLLDAYWQQVADKNNFLDACNILLQSNFSGRDIFFKFYSRELLFSIKARKTFVKPDIIAFDIKLI